MASLLSQAIYSLVVMIAVGACLGLVHGEWLDRFVSGLCGYQYLYSYLILMMLAPALNAWSTRTEFSRECIPVVSILIGWIWLSNMPILSPYLPTLPGLSHNSVFMMVAVYILARLFRRRLDLANIEVASDGEGIKSPSADSMSLSSKVKSLAIRLVFLLPIVALVFLSQFGSCGGYASPIVVCAALLLFDFVRGVRFPKWICKISSFVAPSVFSVYLMQANDVGTGMIARLNEMISLPSGLLYPAVSILIVLGCLVLDIPRRVIVRCFSKATGV